MPIHADERFARFTITEHKHAFAGLPFGLLGAKCDAQHGLLSLRLDPVCEGTSKSLRPRVDGIIMCTPAGFGIRSAQVQSEMGNSPIPYLYCLVVAQPWSDTQLGVAKLQETNKLRPSPILKRELPLFAMLKGAEPFQ